MMDYVMYIFLQVSKEAGIELAHFSNCLFMETSALGARNVKLLFQTMIDEAVSERMGK